MIRESFREMGLLKEQSDMNPVCARSIKGFKSLVVLGGNDTHEG